jgi:predicted TIM-barrel fold metal-dependent hydrolase
VNNKIIYNCHAHIFTNRNLPNQFIRPYIVPALRFKPLRWILNYPVRWILNFLLWISPFDDHGYFNRLFAFIRTAHLDEGENLQRLIDYYPKGSRFVILPMDFGYMRAGIIKEDIVQQHAKLVELAAAHRETVIPFAHIDPRRDNAYEMLTNLVEVHGFKGVKIYPTLGYKPDHPKLMNEIYPYMLDQDIPLMAHCSKGSVCIRGIRKKYAWDYAHPRHYFKVMQKYPNLRICLAHFGGSREWKYHRNIPGDQNPPSWLRCICDLIESGQYENLYVDVSHTIMNFSENHALLCVQLQSHPEIARKVLFGSDFYAGEKMKYTEKMISIDLRHALGEDLFWKIAYNNPIAYLEGKKVEGRDASSDSIVSEALQRAKEQTAESST